MAAPRSVVRRVVISLADSPRREGFISQPGGSAFEVFDAVDNRQGQMTHRFDAERFRAAFGRPPRPAEMGCTLSHLEVMRRFAEQGGGDEDLMLVVEDDARMMGVSTTSCAASVRMLEGARS